MNKRLSAFFTAKHLAYAVGLVMLLLGNHLSAQKPRGGGGPSKPATSARPQAPSKPSAASKPSVQNKPAAVNKNSTQAKPGSSGIADRKPDGKSNINNSGNKTNNIGSNNNKVNIDNSKKNVNVNVDNSKNVRVNNSRNTSVRRNTRPYSRPPYVYGGRRYSCYHPYYFHPYRPFVWGPMWHPWGFFIATLATTAIIVSFADNDMPADINLAMNSTDAHLAFSGPYDVSSVDFQENLPGSFADEYYYDQGVFYLKEDGGYTVVSAPLGALIKSLPSGYETVTLEDNTKNYYYGGTFYEKSGSSYKVVAPLAGSVVEHVSEGGEEVKMGDVTYIKLGETYFQPIQQDGKNMYEVADVEDDK
jgi:hypothetical protein